MFSGRSKRLFSGSKTSTLLRYTLIHTAIMGFFCLLILWLVSEFSLRYIRQHQDLFVFEQLARLKSKADQGSREEIISAVDKLVRRKSNALVVLKEGKTYHGNLNYLPDSVPLSPSVGNFMVLEEVESGFTERELKKVRGSRIETRWGDILVAYNTGDFYLFSSLIKWALYVAMLLALAVASVVGYLFARRLLGRLNEINHITAEVKEGRLNARVPVSQRQDEFDELGTRINAMLDQIEQGMEAVASVTDNIAHDLRTPLSRLRIRMDKLAKEQGHEHLPQLQGELDSILVTFNAMLELSRLEHGGHGLSMTGCNLGELCADVVELAEPLAECKQQKLVLNIHDDFLLKGNSELLFRAIYNLLENAIKYSPDDTAIVITMNRDRLEISDQGPGIPDEERDKVFRRLYRLDQSRKETGFGLGLSLVKVVVDLHGLKIRLFHNKPQGLILQIAKTC